MHTTLVCHPAHPCTFIDRVEVRLTYAAEQGFSLRYQVTGDVEQVRLPAPEPPSRADRLWQHTCFEAFIRPQDTSTYFEFNFSPSRRWAAYRFEDYRSGMTQLDVPTAPAIVSRRGKDKLECGVQLVLPQSIAGTAGVHSIALAAVIEDLQGQRSYWALLHPTDKPDFHHGGAFRSL